ncbi:hypothetical protein M409DRAFT_25573 [Zasmidium cellare ATCC 36951]|uniref:Xylanolytic transcriptional activator regulatory domain-containing protein n=1 Tax=Zasmidium cellare ATCC 36951 TaxID=1080233 RepID=A0A6A6CB16_ZASCE|nr:uncharacterized protein M409DRAFT_25573 [Zasmidium cellare ATCC 36951]KAF2164231.1 hypothetical protein M409DRAFT_25573 [Zasmidium cellare ATCC 36951]
MAFANSSGTDGSDTDAHVDRTYPFRNYWTATGGLGEVMLALPSRPDADVFLKHYMDNVDPLYPVIPRHLFRLRYENFWQLSSEERNNCDPVHVALQFIVFANGKLYVDDRTMADSSCPPETYLSCSYRALCLSSFLSKWSLEVIQVLLLICNYFVTSNRTTDSWTFSGVLQKQAYGLRLHLPPDEHLSLLEKQLHVRLWQAVMFQDVSLSFHLRLVPATMQHSIEVGDLSRVDEGDNNPRRRMQDLLSTSTAVDLDFLTCETDINYVRAMWHYARFMQINVCLPLAIGDVIARDADHRSMLLSELQSTYDTLEPPFNKTDLQCREPRVWRQIIMVTTNYYMLMTMLHMASNPASALQPDTTGALSCSNRAMSAFFALVDANPYHAHMWTAANTRAFLQVNLIGRLLCKLPGEKWCRPADESWLQLAVADFDRYVDLLVHAHGTDGFEVIKVERLALLEAQRKSFQLARSSSPK